jgi:hypothetical protein
MTMLLIGIAIGLALGIAFILVCLWHSRRYPLLNNEAAGTELAQTANAATDEYFYSKTQWTPEQLAAMQGVSNPYYPPSYGSLEKSKK